MSRCPRDVRLCPLCASNLKAILPQKPLQPFAECVWRHRESIIEYAQLALSRIDGPLRPLVGSRRPNPDAISLHVGLERHTGERNDLDSRQLRANRSVQRLLL